MSEAFASPRHAPDAQVVLLEKMFREKSSLKLFVPLFKIDNKDLFSLIQNPGPPARAIDALCNQKEWYFTKTKTFGRELTALDIIWWSLYL